MRIATIYDLPSFDTGRFEGATFLMAEGGASLSVHVQGMDDIVLTFARLRWHEFTALYNSSPEQVKTAYFKLVEIESSDRLGRYISSDQASAKAYRELHHYRIFLDEHGCHEVFAESVSTSRGSANGARSVA